MQSKALTGVMLAAAIAMSLAGCATKGKLGAAKMCAAAGGTYSAQTQSCNVPASAGRKASDMCTAHGGYYDQTAQTCEVGIE